MLVSIISPVYNVAHYICDCIDSIVAQTYVEWEVIFVDDHGYDGSIEIAQRHIETVCKPEVRERFRFVETPLNSGPGIARNIGLQYAKGEYVVFVDSDDMVDERMLDALLLKAYGGLNLMHIGTPGVDMVCCNAKTFGEKGRARLLSNPDITRGKAYFLKHYKTYVWTYLFRRSFLLDNGLRFPNERASEDTNFLTKSLLVARTIRQVAEPLYYYRIRPESLTTARNRTRYRHRLSSIAKLREEVEKIKKEPRYADLHLEQYDSILKLIYFKKGTLQAIKDYLLGLLGALMPNGESKKIGS